MRRRLLALAATVVATTSLLLPAAVSGAATAGTVASTSAPARDAGPRLTVPARKLDAAVRCPSRAELRRARGTVLLIHGTGEIPKETWSWNYARALPAIGFATCTVRLPDRALSSFTRSAEYVVHAVRVSARLSGRPVSLLGHSQGGALAVWVTKFWPDVAASVDDVISLAGPMHGTALGDEACLKGSCPVIAWQLRRAARTVDALEAAPLPRGPSYTSIATLHDEIVRPQPEVSRLDGSGVTNAVLQDICVYDPSEHGLILGDPVAYQLVADALRHDGPAKVRRLPADTCQQTFIPHIDLIGGGAFLNGVKEFMLALVDPRRAVDAEPPLPAYAQPFAR